jgi:hypothetical protein
LDVPISERFRDSQHGSAGRLDDAKAKIEELTLSVALTVADVHVESASR